MTDVDVDVDASVAAVKARTARNVDDLERFAAWLEREGYRSTTRYRHVRLLGRLARWLALEHAVALRAATREHLQAWRAGLAVTPATAGGYVSTVRVFYREFLCREIEARVDDPSQRLAAPRMSKRGRPRPVPEEHVRRILEPLLVAHDRGAEHDRELLAWVLLMRYAGLRRFEVVGALAADLIERDDDSRGGWLTIIGKGGRARTVPIAPGVMLFLRPFARRQGPLFPNAAGAHYDVSTVNVRLRRHLEVVDLGGRGITPHRLRHSFGTRTLQLARSSNRDALREVQTAMGHSSPAVTAVYTEVESTTVADVVDHAARDLRRRPPTGEAPPCIG